MSPTQVAALAAGLAYAAASGAASPRAAGTPIPAWRLAKVLPALMLAGAALPDPLVAGAFAACAVGDLLLLAPAGLLPGLAAFLGGHLLFVPALAARPPAPGTLLAWLTPAVVAILLLWPRLRARGAALRVAVPLYAVVIAAMAAAATTRGALGALGGGLFVLSDALLATHRFARPLPGGDASVLVTYYAALIVLSIVLSPA